MKKSILTLFAVMFITSMYQTDLTKYDISAKKVSMRFPFDEYAIVLKNCNPDDPPNKVYILFDKPNGEK